MTTVVDMERGGGCEKASSVPTSGTDTPDETKTMNDTTITTTTTDDATATTTTPANNTTPVAADAIPASSIQQTAMSGFAGVGCTFPQRNSVELVFSPFDLVFF